MPVIDLQTFIKAPVGICFDLSRSINLHIISTAPTNEKAVGGRNSGLIELGETVTRQATHFGLRQKLTSKITAFLRPFHFRDEQVRGAFKYIKHDHYFEQLGDVVLMKDVFDFSSPLGLLGRLADKIALEKYLTMLLLKRNGLIKEYAATGKWETIVDSGIYNNL